MQPRKSGALADPSLGRIRIPAGLRRIPLSHLPVSVRLGHLLERRGIKRLGDLHNAHCASFLGYRGFGPARLLELETLARAVEAGRIGRAYLQPPDLIRIPVKRRSLALSRLPVSVRLGHVLESAKIKQLGDLHGARYSDFGHLRRCGHTTVRELERLVRRLQDNPAGTDDGLPSDGLELPAPRQFSVAPCARNLSPFDLLLSVRLRSALRKKGVKRLGDLDGMPERELLECGNFGGRSLRELRTLLARAARGEFAEMVEQVPSGGPALEQKLGESLRRVDAFLAGLPARDRELLERRLGRAGTSIPTLEELGTAHKLTRERVRQIVRNKLDLVRQALGPAFKVQIERLAEICLERVVPLTPTAVCGWLPTPWPLVRSAAFYARLLGALCPALPAWPEGQKPRRYQPVQSRLITQGIRLTLEQGRPSLPLRECFVRLREAPGFRRLRPEEFLGVLKRSYDLRVVLDQPEAPEVGLRP